MKRTWIVLTALGLAATSHAVLIDDFQSYPLGNLNENNSSGATSGWFGTSQNTSTGNAKVIEDPINGGPNQVGMVYGSTGGGRGVYKAVAGVTDGVWASLTFDMMINNTNRNVFFGFATDLSGDDVISPFNDYEAFVGLNGGRFEARNGGQTDTLLSDIDISVWHAVQLDVRTDSDTYDVFFDGSMVGTNLAFRVNAGEDTVEVKDLETVTLFANQVTSNDSSLYGAVDNINLTITMVPEPATISLAAIMGGGLLFLRRRRMK